MLHYYVTSSEWLRRKCLKILDLFIEDKLKKQLGESIVTCTDIPEPTVRSKELQQQTMLDYRGKDSNIELMGHYGTYIISSVGYLGLDSIGLLVLWMVTYNSRGTNIVLWVIRNSANPTKNAYEIELLHNSHIRAYIWYLYCIHDYFVKWWTVTLHYYMCFINN